MITYRCSFFILLLPLLLPYLSSLNKALAFFVDGFQARTSPRQRPRRMATTTPTTLSLVTNDEESSCTITRRIIENKISSTQSLRRRIIINSLVSSSGFLLLSFSGENVLADTTETDASTSGTIPTKLTFETLDNGVRVADIRTGKDPQKVVQSDSKVNIHIVGRLLGKNGWIFENSQLDGDDGPYRLRLGNGGIVPGLEQGLIGMAEGGRRRIVVPSAVGYLNKTLEPIPRDFGNRQRLYTTVMNNIRMDRERAQLGTDLAGMVVFDVELLRIR